jgi:hypothetical protein
VRSELATNALSAKTPLADVVEQVAIVLAELVVDVVVGFAFGFECSLDFFPGELELGGALRGLG